MAEQTHPKSIFTNTNENIKLNADTIYKPLRSYLLYVVIRILKQVSTIVIFFLTLSVALILSLLPSFFAADQRSIVIMIVPMILIVTLVCLTATFGVTKSLDIFVGFQTEGTELIIVSKPISRSQILIVKFFFLFILGLLYCAIITIFCTIGFAVVGFEEYANSGVNLGGIFAANLLAYMVMGLLAIAISIISDTSEKIAKTMPPIILALSATLSVMVPQLITSTNQNPSVDQVARFNTALVKAVAGQSGTDKLKYGTDEVNRVTTLSNLPFSYDKTNSAIVISGLTVSYGSPEQTVIMSESAFWGIGGSVDPHQTDLEKIYTFATEVASAEFNINGLQTTGQGWTAFNYLNPISAFLAISGLSISMSTSNTGLPYNYSFEDFSVITTPKIGMFSYPAAIKVGKANQADPQWALALLWVIIWLGLGTYTVIAYNWKDFK